MGTRGVVAVGTIRKWRGNNHWDSYPTGLGKELYEHLMERMLRDQKTLAEIGADILHFDDWRNYLKGGVCEYCGQIASQPHSISGIIYGKETKPGNYPDPKCKRHQHEPLTPEMHILPTQDCGGLEWVYVIDPAANVVHVLRGKGRRVKGEYKWSFVPAGDLRFDAPPNFQVIECGAKWEYCNHYAWAHFPELSRDSRIGTRKYLGYEPLNVDDATHVYINGKKGRVTGSGRSSESWSGRRYWLATIEWPDGSKTDERIYDYSKNGRRKLPIKGIRYEYPETLAPAAA